MSVGNRIMYLRKNLGLSQEEFASPLGVNRSHIAGIERELRIPSGHLLKLICNYYNVNEEWLKTGEGGTFLSPDQIIRNFITRWGRQAFLDASDRVLAGEQGVTPAGGPFPGQDCAVPDDPDLKRMIDILYAFWSAEDKRLRQWASVQFDRAFPEDMIEKANKKTDR